MNDLKNSTYGNNIRKLLLDVFCAGILVLLTLPSWHTVYSGGLDSPLVWVFNAWFRQNPFSFPVLAFPYGPLAFLMFPMYPNALPFIMFYSIMAWFLWKGSEELMNCNRQYTDKKTIFFVSLLCLLVLNVLYLLLMVYLIYLVLFIKKKFLYKYFFVASFFLSAIFFCKINVGVMALAFFYGCVLWMLYKRKLFIFFTTQFILFLVFFIFGWLWLGTISGVGKYVVNTLFVSLGNNDIALYADENLFLMILPFVILFGLYYYSDDISFRNGMIFIMMIPSWIAFKHGFTRQDSSHVHDVMLFFFVMLFLYYMLQYSFSLIKFIFGFLSVFLIHLNVFHTYNTENFNILPFRSDVWLWNIPLKNISDYYVGRQLELIPTDSAVYKKIKSGTVDVFPWNPLFSLVNQAVWKPRPSLYVNSNFYADRLNTSYLKSGNAPEWYIITKVPLFNGSDYGSTDEKYLLNEEPMFVDEFISRYSPDTTNWWFLLFKKRKVPLAFTVDIMQTSSIRMYHFYPVPSVGKNEILKICITPDKNIIKTIASILYKPDPIYLKIITREGIILSFRLTPYSLQNGIWIMPFFYYQDVVLTPEYFSIETSMFATGRAQFKKIFFHDSINENILWPVRRRSIKCVKEFILPLRSDTVIPCRFSYLKDTILSGHDYRCYEFRFKTDTMPLFNAFLHIDILYSLSAYRSMKEIKFVLYKRKNLQFFYPVREWSAANFYMKNCPVQRMQCNLFSYELERDAEYSLRICNLTGEELRLLRMKLNLYNFK